MATFTATQGRYLAFIHSYIQTHGYAPAESEVAAAMCVSPPSVNMMVKTLEKKGLISREPGLPRSIEITVPEDEIPSWNGKRKKAPVPRRAPPPKYMWVYTGGPKTTDKAPSANVYVLNVGLTMAPLSKKFANKVYTRGIEIRGDQTLEELHDIIFDAFDRDDEHLYQFQFGKRPHDKNGPNYGIENEDEGEGDATTTTLDDLGLKVGRVFGYWFDFGDDWYHQIEVEKIERTIPTVKYPRITKRVGKSPPQYREDEY